MGANAGALAAFGFVNINAVALVSGGCPVSGSGSYSVAPQWIAFFFFVLLAVSAAAWLGSLVWLLRGNNWFHDPDPLSSGATPRLSQLQPYILATLWILLTAIGEMVRWVSNTTLF